MRRNRPIAVTSGRLTYPPGEMITSQGREMMAGQGAAEIKRAYTAEAAV
jgi:hypothetical protein